MALEMASAGYLGLVRCGSFGRKRVAPPSFQIEFEDRFDVSCLKRQRSQYLDEKLALEDLPQEILIRILCGVGHDDLKSLFFVSKSIREATVIAKKFHFAYSTPKKTLLGIRNAEELCDFEEIEPPKAPKQSRVARTRLSYAQLSEISVTLFAI